MTLIDEVEAAIQRMPGSTLNDIADFIGSEFRRVAPCLTTLRKRDLVRREGEGGRTDPFRYFAVEQEIEETEVEAVEAAAPGEDTVLDLIGYLVLLCIAERNEVRA